MLLFDSLARDADEIGAQQGFIELKAALAFLSAFDPIENFLEIGLYRGATFYAWSKLCRREGIMLSIDNFSMKLHQNRGPYDPVMMDAFVKKCGPNAQLLIGDSLDPAIMERVAKALNEKSLDWLFIDGCHRREHVERELKVYAPLVKHGGFIGFHDISPGGDSTITVPSLWNELPGYKWSIMNASHGGVIGILQHASVQLQEFLHRDK